MSKFKVGDKVKALYNVGSSKKGCICTIAKCWCNPKHEKCYVRLVEHLSKSDTHSHYADDYELVETNPVLTPEEVFEYLRNGTKLEVLGVRHARTGSTDTWLDVSDVDRITYHTIVTCKWRIKPEPEIIELNGKKYREIVE